VHTLTPDGPQAELFWATVGGMGLTGITLRATIALKRCESAYFVVDTDRTADLDELMALLTDGSDDRYDYSAAWFDTTTTGAALGRAVLTRGSLARREELPAKLRGNPLRFDAPQLLRFPDVFPNGLANPRTLRAFSELWYRKAPKRQRDAVQNITAFYQALDVFADWNRVYGKRGFLQYQFIVPFGAETVFRRIVETIASSGHSSGLNVLKRFGAGNQAPLSFPTPGWTICVDFPIAAGLAELCNELDAMVLDAGGRHYLAKESRTSPAAIRRGYPRLDEWRKVRAAADPDGVFTSDMARRLELV
jgi:decaprenylphospho-beta-D-ribofuranose 2-oxidase